MDFNVTDLLSLFTILRKAATGQALTPSERAIAKGWEGIVDAVFIAVAFAAFQFFFVDHQNWAAIDWTSTSLLFFGIAVKAFKDAFAKFHKAQSPQEQQQGLFLESIDLLKQSTASEAGVPPK